MARRLLAVPASIARIGNIQQFFADRLISQCAGIPFQGKGLLATEACVTFPIVGQENCALAIRSHFFEFYPETSHDCPVLAHQVVIGQRYSVVVTTGGGLYRYPLHDLVEVTGKYGQCPLICFVGRNNQTSDMVGEKLNEAFVRDCIDATLNECQLECSFAAIAPILVGQSFENRGSHYCLRIEVIRGHVNNETIKATIEKKLCRNIHYEYARNLGQLGAVPVEQLPGPPGTVWSEYESKMQAHGKQIGALKPTAILDCNPKIGTTG